MAMHIFLLRHGNAAPVSTSASRSDAERPLTDEGRELLREACHRYAPHLPAPNRIVCSPFLRARQTADILADVIGYRGAIEPNPALEPGARPTSILDQLQGDALEGRDAVVLVGHEPHLGNLLGLLLTGSQQVSLPLQKGMICGVEVRQPKSMFGRLVLCLPQGSRGSA